MRILRIIAYSLVIVGAVVWGLLGIFNINIVAAMFGDGSILSRIIYSLVGISAIVLLATHEYDECYCNCSEREY
ncbi:DUF378 domain-containing protein [bacterium]|nr:DUF378 domain-containing protein [bacterium]